MAHGFRVWQQSGSLAVSEDETVVRFVGRAFLDMWTNYTNQPVIFSMPSYEEARGVILATPHAFKFDFINDGRVADNAAMAGQYYQLLNSFVQWDTRFNNEMPTYSWDNATKELTVTPTVATVSDWSYTFYHYK